MIFPVLRQMTVTRGQMRVLYRSPSTLASSAIFPEAPTVVANSETFHLLPLRSYSSSIPALSSPFDSNATQSPRKRGRRKKKFVPRKAAVTLTEPARQIFIKLLESKPEKDGIMLDYHQSSSGQPRMVFSFRFVTVDDLVEQDEGVTLEVNEDGTPKTPTETLNDGKPKLYINHNAFLKVLGATVDVDMETITPILYDKEGNEMDPNV